MSAPLNKLGIVVVRVATFGGRQVMTDVSVAQIPAGWYPDPLGLPQRRWWDSGAWTQHVAPVQEPASRANFAAHTHPDSSQHAATHAGGYSEQNDAGTTITATRRPADTPITGHAYIPMAVNTPVQFRQPVGLALSYTVAVWLIAVMPVIQLAVVLMLIFGLADFGHFMQAGVGLVFFLWSAVLASRDKHALRTAGYAQAASPWWLLLSPLAYLIARTVHIHRQGGHASAPMWVYLLLSTMPVALATMILIQINLIHLVLIATTQ